MAGSWPQPSSNRHFTMQIFLNGVAYECDEGLSLAEFLSSIGMAQNSCATAVNQAFVARESRAQTRLQPNDQIMTFEPITGG